jgi:fatty acid desaturase
MLLLNHEASHLNLVRGRAANYVIGNLFVALPIGQSVESYAVTHRPHHSHLNTGRDTAFYVTNPDLPRKQVIFTLASLLFGRVLWDLVVRSTSGRRADSTIKTGGEEKVSRTERTRLIAVLMYHAPIIATAFYFEALWMWIAWTASTITLVPFLDGLRTIGEHRRGTEFPEQFHTRSHHLNMFLSAVTAPFFQYHWEHHALPGIPHYQLARLHRILVEAGVRPALPVPGGLAGAFWRGLTPHRA